MRHSNLLNKWSQVLYSWRGSIHYKLWKEEVICNLVKAVRSDRVIDPIPTTLSDTVRLASNLTRSPTYTYKSYVARKH